MTKGLKRNNNLSDVLDKGKALANLGLSLIDYEAIANLYPGNEIDFSVIGNIAGSEGNYQSQLDIISATLSGVQPASFLGQQGGTIQGDWTHVGGITVLNSGLPSGFSPSSDPLFVLSIENNEPFITASGLVVSGLNFQGIRQASGLVMLSGVPSGATVLAPLQIAGAPYFIQGQAI